MKYEVEVIQEFREVYEIEAESESMATEMASEKLAFEILQGNAMPYEDFEVYSVEED